MRRFYLLRTDDIHGNSGTGRVAEGCEFHDGTCALTWRSKIHTETWFDKWEDIIALHGHDGRTTIEWVDEARLDND